MVGGQSNSDKLKRKREEIKQRLARTFKFVEDFTSDQNINSIKTRENAVRDALDEFNKVQEQIEDNVSIAELEAQTNERIEFENIYFETMTAIATAIESYDKTKVAATNNNQSSTAIQSHQNSKINLPVIQIPEFSGHFEKWLSFRDVFQSLIHNNNNLNSIEKMHYLKSSLSGDALHTIENLAISGANYDEAWSLLEKRYGNERLIVQAHIRKILNSPAINKCTAASLRQLSDDVRSNLAALKALNRPVQHWDDILVTIIPDKLDFHSNREWQGKLGNEMPDSKTLLDFLESRYQHVASITASSANQTSQEKSGQNKSSKHQSSSNSVIINKQSCAFCKKTNHSLHQCTSFLRLSTDEKLKQVISLKLCENCLRGNHSTANCKSNNTCRDCKSRHHTLLHGTKTQINDSVPSTSTVSHCNAQHSENLLLTAVVLVKDCHEKYHQCRALLDAGSQSNFITRHLTNKLKLKTIPITHKIIGINAQPSNVTESVNINIKSICSDYGSNLNCLVLSKITGNLPLASFSKEGLRIPQHLELADKAFNVKGPIDLLLGTGLFLSLLKDGQISLQNGHLRLQNTHLGWVLGGQLHLQGLGTVSTNNVSINMDNLNSLVGRFWEVEGYKPLCSNNFTKDEIKTENHFIQTFQKDVTGRFIVKLPSRNNVIELGDSYNLAKKRFLNLESKLIKNKQFQIDYGNFIREYRNLGHMENVPLIEINNPDCYYLPHHAVYKNSLDSKKIRVVFDASAKSNNGKSLNDNLLVGPKLQQDLLEILIRFRTHQYVLNADITKMYRQIKISEHDKDYQRIIWRDNPNQPLQIFRLTTVTYGTASAPFLAVRCLQQLAHENKNDYPSASNVILNDFYIDDLLTGSDSKEKLLTIRDQLIKILNSGGFELSKWTSNEATCLPHSNNRNVNNGSVVQLDKGSETKTLGLYWNFSEDQLKYNISPMSIPNKTTKRNILSTICQIFDPLGLISPVIVSAKVLLQTLWTRNLDWDQAVPSDIKSRWLEIINGFNTVSGIQIPRKVIIKNSTKIELHGFSDASERAYGAAIYLKTIDKSGHVQVQLLIAKSRVAPLKSLTIPRLELLAACLLAQLANKVIGTLNTEITQQFYWTDSTIVLAWLAREPIHWQTFVAHRVADIQSKTSINNWYHVDSADNPADILSRGASPSQLRDNALWWHGPSWLENSTENYQTIKITNQNLENIPEKKGLSIGAVVTNEELDIFTKCSDFPKLKRVVAYVCRFINNAKRVNNKITGPLTTEELNVANNVIVKSIQKRSFAEEYHQLSTGGGIEKNSTIRNLSPFLDENGVIRVGGRIRNANLAYNQKHPVLIPKNHNVTEAIIRHFHVKNLHSGTQSTLASIRQQYWPIAGRNKIKQIIHKCISCFRAKPIIAQQKMGDLPVKRLEPARPFINSGLDYCGPILIKTHRGRGKQKTIKAYVCLFICLSTKAIHIELVSDLTADTFLDALKRFVSRRGTVKSIISDNATNFIKANKDLIDLHQFFQNSEISRKLVTTLSNENIQWKFIPPRTPNFGGLWEAGVKSVKFHIKRVVGETVLTYDELYTLLTRIEACLNSRPLVPMSNDPNDLTAITPGHFLIGEALTAPLEPDLTELKINRLSRHQLLERLRQHFWKRWRTEYLSYLQGRTKWQSPSPSLQPGDLVLLVEDNVPPLCWPLGRIQQVHPGSDGNVRVVTVKTNTGTYKRGVRKVCVIPIESHY
jgi:hypothetical protein